ncbi:MAG: dehydrogenase [Sediminibacterium sp.]|nr:dehydrogenase [Sediminibacterium sp.]
MLYRSRAPLRLGLAGGGTDVSPFSDEYGGCILNTTISLAAHATIEENQIHKICFEALDRNEKEEFEFSPFIEIKGSTLQLAKGVYNRIQKQFNEPIKSGFTISTYVDAVAGSGLGTSSTLVVAIIGAFVEWLKLPLGEYDIAQLAYSIEREDLMLSGGKQDQYAATFGGFNFMEFYKDKVIVNPLRIKSNFIMELEHNLLLYYTKTSRESAKIIDEQVKNVTSKNEKSVSAMLHLKEQAMMMKEALLKGQLDTIGEILDYGFQQKRLMAANISNSFIEEIYETAKKAGASGGKISGAGGGGFMFFYCPKNTKFKVKSSLEKLGGVFKDYQFNAYGLSTWRVN